MNSPDVRSSSAIAEKGRRRHPRYTVNIQIEVQREGTPEPLRLETTDLSRGGCYVQPAVPLPIGVPVQTTLWLDGCPVVIRGRVVTRHPESGNGIMFVDFEGQAEPLLNRYLKAITT